MGQLYLETRAVHSALFSLLIYLNKAYMARTKCYLNYVQLDNDGKIEQAIVCCITNLKYSRAAIAAF